MPPNATLEQSLRTELQTLRKSHDHLVSSCHHERCGGVFPFAQAPTDDEVIEGDIKSCYTTTIHTCKHFIKNNYKISTSYTQNDGISRQYAKGISIQKLLWNDTKYLM